MINTDGVRCMLFDLDGTLIDSMAYWRALTVHQANMRFGNLSEELEAQIAILPYPQVQALLSKTFSVSDSYIARMFKTRLGMTPSDYINTVRIESACNLLLNSKMKIGDIAYKTGFYSPYYFSRVFKKIHGITPGGFRKNEQIMNP